MEVWLILGLLGYVAFAISTSIDKYFMNEHHNAVTTDTFKMFFNGTILLIIGLIFFNLQFTWSLFFWSLLLGFLYAITGIIYFTVLQKQDVEVVIPYAQSATILFTFIGSLLIFKEIAIHLNFLGVLFILVGIYAVLSKDGFAAPKLDKVFFLIFGIVILHTIYWLLVKNLLFIVEPVSLAILMYFSTTLFLTGFVLFSKNQRKKFKLASGKIAVSSIFGSIGTLLLYSALAIGNASKVYPLAGAQVVFIFILATLFLKEKFQWHRLIGTVIVGIGIYFVAL
jgi:uncharacterized membrane protein